MKFSENLKKYRIMAGYQTGREFAAAMNIPYQRYMNYENKDVQPKYDILCTMADRLGITTDELLGREVPQIARYKELVRGAGFRLSPMSPPGCISIEYDDDLYNAIQNKFGAFPLIVKGAPVAIPIETFTEWVNFALYGEDEDGAPVPFKGKLINAFVIQMVYDLSKIQETKTGNGGKE